MVKNQHKCFMIFHHGIDSISMDIAMHRIEIIAIEIYRIEKKISTMTSLLPCIDNNNRNSNNDNNNYDDNNDDNNNNNNNNNNYDNKYNDNNINNNDNSNNDNNNDSSSSII